MDWRKFFVPSAAQSLQFFPPKVAEGFVTVEPPSEVFDHGVQVWQNSLVLQFIDRPPNFEALQRTLKNLWGTTGGVDIKTIATNLYVVRLSSAEARDWVFEHVFGSSYIASATGVPLYMDSITASQSRLAYAKVCVEIDASIAVPKTIDVILRNGSMCSVWVEIPWLPLKCAQCKTFGHDEKGCSKKKTETQVWVPKVAEPVMAESGSSSSLPVVLAEHMLPVVEPIVQRLEDALVDSVVSAIKIMDAKVGRGSILAKGRAVINTNRFDAIAGSDMDVIEAAAKSPKKIRAAAVGAAELLKELHKKKKGQVDRGKRGETRVKCSNARSIVAKWFPGWSFVCNYEYVVKGRIWILWQPGILIQSIAASAQSITCSFSSGLQSGHFTAVYGSNDGRERSTLWLHLLDVQVLLGTSPWFIAGDFNIIADPSESSSSQLSSQLLLDMDDFKEWICAAGVQDHPFLGSTFTWTNNQCDGFLARKLDRVLVSGDWFGVFDRSEVEFLAPHVSDHCPAILELRVERASVPKPFKFFNFWTRHPDFLAIVEDSWKVPIAGSPMLRLFLKLKRLKVVFRRLNKECYADISQKVLVKRKELDDLQLKVLRPNVDITTMEQTVKLNPAKSEVFSAGISHEVLDDIHVATGFTMGQLPVRYLGVPLVAKRLTERDCVSLLDKVRKRVSGWAAKTLSFAGRTQLIKSVLFHVQSYWVRHFMMPKSILKKIEQICMRFLWSGSDEKTSSARVSWKQVCLPKCEGGLGIKDLISWNKACLIQQLWYILYKDGSLWIAWIKAYLIKDRDFCLTAPSSSMAFGRNF
ncbi:hypothetical protein K2173_003922 [Erythroxylum novogranatense]|uniref:DUF4283 domain-containing protein n=1 Tax=Erythroxylum novogranatense TaxID=1862640 RepID=A0AAV8SJ36_9ROSI|nr:hypothetical protein K2173_003922 [Erythroxylum novogranatense]